MRSSLGRCIGAAIGLLACVVGHSAAQSNRGFELGGDAAIEHYEFSLPGGIRSVSNSLALPISSLRIAFLTSGPFEPELAANLNYSTSGGRSTSYFAGDIGLLTEISHDPGGPRWFVRPALGWQHSTVTNGSATSRATLGAGIGVRLGITDRIAARYEARYTYLTEARGVSASVLGLRAGISVFTR
jgi:hypothetical protein